MSTDRDPFALPDDMDPRAISQADQGISELSRFIGALRRDDIPTLGEVKAAMPMVTRADGGLVPERLNRDGGWGDDADRDSQAAQELARLVKKLDDLVHEWRNGSGSIFLSEFIDDLTETWAAIRKITRENGGK